MRKFSLTLLITTVLFAAFAVAAQRSGVNGKVRDPKGKGVAGAVIEGRQDGKVIRSVTADAKGNFTLNLEPGTYNVSFDADGFSTGVLYNIEIKQNNIRNLGDRLILSRDRGSQILIKGIVFDKNQLSVIGAVVDLYVIKSDGSEKKIATVYSNESGDFSFRAIDPVPKVRVKATFRGISETKEIETDQPQVYRMSIILPYERPKAN